MAPDLTIKQNTNGTATVSGICKVTKKSYSITVNAAGLMAYVNGELVQHAMPKVPMEQREFLISGISPEGWSQLFGA